jgi:hypothetical protein
MTDTAYPTRKDILKLTAFLPELYAPGFQPVLHWHGGTSNAKGYIQMPYPEYDKTTEAFYRQAATPCFLDYGYSPEEAARQLEHPEQIETLSLDEICSLLTFCVRGERFSDGHWAEMIEKGHIRRILERLVVIGESLPE